MYVLFSIRVVRSVCFAWYSCGSKCMFRLVFVWLEECFAGYSYGSSMAIRVAQRAFCIYINVLWDMGHSVHEKSIGNITFTKRGIKRGYIQVNTIKPSAFFNIDIIFTVSLKVFLVVLVVCGLFVCLLLLLLLCVCLCVCVHACVRACVRVCVRVCVCVFLSTFCVVTADSREAMLLVWMVT